MVYDGDVIGPIVIDATYGATTSNRVVMVPLSSLGVDLSQFGDGRSLDLLGGDQETSLSHAIRNWGAGVGFHFESSRASRTGNGTYTWNAAVRFRAVDLETYANGPHIVWAAGDNLSATWRGELGIYDSEGNFLAAIGSPNDDYVMSVDFADVDGDGEKEVLLGTRYADHGGFVLNQDGSVLWSWDAGASKYVRLVVAGNMTDAYAGLEVACGVSDGRVSLRRSDGTEIWTNTYTSNNLENSTIQGGYIIDPTGGGTSYLYFVQGTMLRKVNAAGATVWTFTHSIQVPGVRHFNFYEVANGFLESLSVKSHVMAASAMPGNGTLNMFYLCLVDDSGALVREKQFLGACFNVACHDIDGDGYDEIVVGLDTGQSGDSHGGYLVLDRNFEKLAEVWLPGNSRSQSVADYKGDASKYLIATSEQRMFFYKIATGSNVGASAKVTVPSVTGGATQNIYLAKANNSTLIPPVGDYYWDLSGANGTAVPGGTAQGTGVWTIQNNLIESGDSGNTSAVEYLDFAAVSQYGFVWEFSASKPNQGDGLASDYYIGCWYGASGYSSGRPLGYHLNIGAKGNMTLLLRQAGTGTTLATLLNTATSGLTFSTTDTLRLRVAWSGYDHALAVKKNGGEWKVYLRQSYSGGSAITSAGSLAFSNQRGRSRYWDSRLHAIPSAYSQAGIGKGAFSRMDALPESSGVPIRRKWYPGLMRR